MKKMILAVTFAFLGSFAMSSVAIACDGHGEKNQETSKKGKKGNKTTPSTQS